MSAEQGRQCVKDADKKLKGNFFGLSKDPDGAVDDLTRACNNFKVAQCWEEAATAQLRIAALSEKAGEDYDQASALLEAAKLQARFDQPAAVESTRRAKDLYIQKGRVAQAARACRDMAAALKDTDTQLAISTYQQAAHLYDSDSSFTDQCKMLLEAAMLMGQANRFAEAADIFATVGGKYSENSLLKYSARDAFLNAGLCWLALGDSHTLAQKLEDFKYADVSFEDSRHCRLVTDCLAALDAGSPEEFSTAVKAFDDMTKLEAYRVHMLNVAKGVIKEGNVTVGDVLGGDDDLDLT